MNPYVHWFRKVPLRIRVCRTHMYGRRLDHAWLSTGPKSSEAHIWKLYMLIFKPRAIRPHLRPKFIKTSYKPAARSSAQSDQGFRYALNWQIRAQSFFIRTAESNQTELGAHAISVLYQFHNNCLLACVETNKIKTSCFETMSNEKWKKKKKKKNVMFTNNAFYRNRLSVSGIYKKLKAYAIIMLQIQHDCCCIVKQRNVLKPGITMLYSNCNIYSNTFRFTRHHIL